MGLCFFLFFEKCGQERGKVLLYPFPAGCGALAQPYQCVGVQATIAAQVYTSFAGGAGFPMQAELTGVDEEAAVQTVFV
jgi:hypothetical protein